MAYNGPPSGSLNFLLPRFDGPFPWVTSTAYAVDDEVTYRGVTFRCAVAHTSSATSFNSDYLAGRWAEFSSTAPTDNDGTDGDFAFDLSTALLYGPKDGSDTLPWPAASRLWSGIRNRGAWYLGASPLYSQYYPGDVVTHAGSGSSKQYLCIKAFNVNPVNVGSTYSSGATGTFTAGDQIIETGASEVAVCWNDATLTPQGLISVYGALAGLLLILLYWMPVNPYADDLYYKSDYATGIAGNWIELSDTIQADTASPYDAGLNTRLIVPDSAITAAKIATNAVTTAKLDGTAGSEAVTTAKIRANAVTDAKIATGISPSKITGTAVITTDSRLSDDRTPTMAYALINSNPLFLTYYNLTLTNRFVEIAEVTNISTINFPTSAPAQGTMWMVRNARTSVSLTVNAMSGGNIVSSGGSVASVTVAPTETAIFVYAGSSNYIRVEVEPAAVINNTRFLQITPSSNGTAFEVRNAAAASVLAVNTTSTTVATKQYLEHTAYLDATGIFTVKASDLSTVFQVDSSPKQTIVNGLTALNGSVAFAYRAITGARTLDGTDHTVNCTSGTFDVTLPTASGITGRVYVVKNSGTGTITVKTTSSQTIDGQTTVSLNQQYQSITVQSTGSAWVIL